MARSPRGRSSIGQAAAVAAASLLSDPANAATPDSQPPQAQGIETASPAPTPAPKPQALPEVVYGKTLDVPDNFLGDGYTGQGWTVDEATSEGGKPVVKIHRRVKETGNIEEHTISPETYEAAQEYKDAQGGVSKGFKAPVLKKVDLGRSLDPEGDIIPDRFDAATRSYRVQLPGARESQWVPEAAVKDIKEGKPGAIQRLREVVGLDGLTTKTPAQAVGGAVAGAILGKNLATRLGLREKNQEQSPDRPSAPQTAAAKNIEANRAANLPEDRARLEAERRNNNLQRRRNRQASLEQSTSQDQTQSPSNPLGNAVAYSATSTPGQSSQVEVGDKIAEQASATIGTTQAGGLAVGSNTGTGTRLNLNQVSSPTAEVPTEIAATNADRRASASPDRVAETLARSDARTERRRMAGPGLAGAEGVALGTVAVTSAVQAAAPQVTEMEVTIRRMRELMQAQAKDQGLTLTNQTRITQSSTPGPDGRLSLTVSGGNTPQRMIGVQGKTDINVNGSIGVVGQVAGGAGSAVALQGARLAVQAIAGVEGVGREQALTFLRSALKTIEGQTSAASQQLTRTSSAVPLQPSSSFTQTINSEGDTAQSDSEMDGTSGQIRVTAHSQAQQDLGLLQRSLGALKNAEQGVAALPANTAVPAGFGLGVAGLAGLAAAIAADQVDEPSSGVEPAVQAFRSAFSPRIEPSATIGTPSQASSEPSGSFGSQPTQNHASSPIRIGAPPVSPLRPIPLATPGRVGTYANRPALPSFLNTAMNLDSAQARERRGESQAASDALTDDSMPSESNGIQAAPLSSAYTNDTPSPEEAEDLFQTSGEEAQRARKTAEETRATGAQFSGTDGITDNNETDTRAEAGTETGGSAQSQNLSPEQQLGAATQMQWLQQLVQKDRAQKQAEAAERSAKLLKTVSALEKTFTQRLTSWKLIWDFIEGCFDGIGFLEFLADSNLALINDKYFNLNALPSLKSPGPETAQDRYVRRGIILLDIMIVFGLLCAVAMMIVVIVMLVSPAAVVVRTVTGH